MKKQLQLANLILGVYSRSPVTIGLRKSISGIKICWFLTEPPIHQIVFPANISSYRIDEKFLRDKFLQFLQVKTESQKICVHKNFSTHEKYIATHHCT